ALMARRHRPHFLDAVTRLPHVFALRISPGGHLLATHATLAGDSTSRRRGLLDRDGLAAGEGLVIAPTQGIHTFGMRFPIDVVFADRLGRVVHVAEAVPPSRIRLAWRGFAAIELAAGACRSAALRRGDRLEVQPA
ncbi:MAG: DUF192 domain-containing protein, partial [Acidobacteria bacterium]|nr:DUF192 domain-containing protein [Acidobacteriota bacterium]